MKVVVLGAGRMGSGIGACMKLAGDEVYLIDTYQAHIDQINENGLRWKINDGAVQTIHFDGAYTQPNGLSACDVVILLTSGIYTNSVIKNALGNVIGPETYVVTFQNGLGNVETIAQYVDMDHILHGMLKLGGQIYEPGFVQTLAHPDCCVPIGSVRNAPAANEVAKKVAASITAGGIISAFYENIDFILWEKIVVNCAINALASLTRSNMGNVIAGEHGRPLMLACIREVVAVANVRGIPLQYGEVLNFIDTHSYKNNKNHYPSMTYDVRAKHVTEVDFLNGAISRYGKETGVPTPANDMITQLIKTLEDGYATGF